MLQNLTDDKIKFLEERAKEIRISIIEMLVSAGSGHSAGPLGMADIFSALYFYILRHDPKVPVWPGRDRLGSSNRAFRATPTGIFYLLWKHLQDLWAPVFLRRLGWLWPIGWITVKHRVNFSTA